MAVRIKRDLEALGHEVWFDVERLKIGGDWERYIEDGLDFASAVPDTGRFMLLMTPHSVRRPNGVNPPSGRPGRRAMAGTTPNTLIELSGAGLQPRASGGG